MKKLHSVRSLFLSKKPDNISAVKLKKEQVYGNTKDKN